MIETKSLLHLEVPNHDEELEIINETINKYKHIINKNIKKKTLSEETYSYHHAVIMKCLYALGELSLPNFNLHDELKKKYNVHYKKTPELAKKLYLDHMSKIHKDYNLLKNRCFRLLDHLEEYAIEHLGLVV